MRNVSHHHKQGKQQQTSRAKRWIGWGANLLICLHGTLAWAGHAFYDYANPLPAAEIEVVYSAWTSYPYGGLNNPYPSAAAACAVNKLSLIAGFVGTSPSAGAASCAYGFNCYYNLQDCLFTNYNFPGDIGITTSGNAYQIPSCPAGYTMMTRPTGQFACRKNNAIPDCPTPKIRPDIAFKFVAFTQNYGSVYPGICERWYCPNPAENPVSQNQGGITVMECVPNETYTITLSGGTTTEPASLLPFNAIVKDQNGVAKPGKQVTIKADVQSGTGGHIHTANRPKGGFTCSSALGSSPASCTLTTDASGQVQFDFVATPISGKHTITATCDGCSNTETKNVDVMVSGLIPIPASSRYALQDSAGAGIGAIPGKHTANHYLTSAAIKKLKVLADLYKTEINSKRVLYLNDASLEWGGLFDVGKDTPWASPHSAHDRGLSLDIRAEKNDPNYEGAVLAADFIEFNKQAKSNGFKMGLHCNGSVVTRVCLNIPENRHFHVDF